MYKVEVTVTDKAGEVIDSWFAVSKARTQRGRLRFHALVTREAAACYGWDNIGCIHVSGVAQ